MFQDALSAWKKPLSLSPNAIDARWRLASGYSALGREDEARNDVRAVLKMNPKLSLAYLANMYPYKNKADLDKVIDALQKAGLK